MMTSFTPLGHRLIAWVLFGLMLMLVASWIVIPIWQANRETIGRLKQLRQSLAYARAIREMPKAPPVRAFPDGGALWANDIPAATRSFAGYLTSAAIMRGVRLTLSRGAIGSGKPPLLLIMDLKATGPRDALLDYMKALEIGHPRCKFLRFQISNTVVAALPSTMASTDATQPQAERRLELAARVAVLWGGAK